MTGDWRLWFIQLSGWPVFLAVVAITVLFGVALSVGLTWLGNRSVLHAALIAMLATVLVLAGLFAALAIATRIAFPD